MLPFDFFNTNIGTLINDLIIVEARIYFKTSKEGGRNSGIKSGYRPNHVFEQPKDLKNIRTYIGDILFDEQELIQPGETKIVTVRFLRNPIVEQYIKVGQRWFIYEVPRLVAEGEIIEILQS
jgi:translation elongation factor EF-Tu-like GTPase